MKPLVVRARNPTTSAKVANTIALPAVWWATSSAAGSEWPLASRRLNATIQWIELSTDSPIDTAAIMAVPMLIRDLGGVPREEALSQAGKVARARAARRDGEARQFGRIVVALVLAGLAVLAYALVLFLPAIDFFMAISEASASR